jgi:hypothetical protein
MRLAIIDNRQPPDNKNEEIGPIYIGSANRPNVGDKVLLCFSDGTEAIGTVTSVSGKTYEDWSYKARID